MAAPEPEAHASATNGAPAVAMKEKDEAISDEKSGAEVFGVGVRPPRRRQDGGDVFVDAVDTARSGEEKGGSGVAGQNGIVKAEKDASKIEQEGTHDAQITRPEADVLEKLADSPPVQDGVVDVKAEIRASKTEEEGTHDANAQEPTPIARPEAEATHAQDPSPVTASPSTRRHPSGTVSEYSHQQLAPPLAADPDDEDEELKWQQMPALAEHRIYDDWGKVLAKSYSEVDEASNTYGYGNLGGAGKGYTRVQMDEDAQSATSMDDNTAYLFKETHARHGLDEEDEEGRDVVSQMQATKLLLTEGQRMAYVGLVRLGVAGMIDEMGELEKMKLKGAKKVVELANEMLKMWGQKIMVRLYSHMDISSAEQMMVEQLAEHGVRPDDLTPALMQNARVKNPSNIQKDNDETASVASQRPSLQSPRTSSTAIEKRPSPSRSTTPALSRSATPLPSEEAEPDAPPAYSAHAAEDFTLQDPSTLSHTSNIDLDIRWTVLCDLFLLLIADSTYDARSRTLLERVGAALSVEWQEICRFEKRVTDALEMQEQADKENWNEEDHMAARRKRARNKRLMVMGLCTVGGGLVIGLSAGMLAPVIGAGLAAGFTGIGVAGTGSVLGGTGAAALIGTTGSFIGGTIGLRGADRRMGAVSTFEYRPLFNNKRVNLIVTVSGWMAGKVDDVRLPFSTVDPVMGDIYSVNWEPEMLQSTGQTIQILGTEALTQTIQQILGATFLATLMAGLSLPIVLTKLAYLIDNPWTVSLARADATGLILADSLVDRNLGVRPITLVGFSLGSRVIFSCLRELAKRGALGLVQNVYLFGSPVVVKKEEWTRARTVVSGRFVNGYAVGDWILAYLFRATAGGVMRVAGLNTVEIPGIENVNVTEDVPGHMAYRGMMPTLLHRVGWVVESEEFTEIEDPDPENHVKRQRELISEIEEARRELEGKPEKKGFKAFFSRRKAARKQEWETYDAEAAAKNIHEGKTPEVKEDGEGNGEVMFDVEAIRKEALKLAMEGGDLEEIKRDLQVKELASTMPALKITSPVVQQNGFHANGEGKEIALHKSKSLDGSRPTTTVNGLANGHAKAATTSPYEHDHDDDITMSFESPTRPRPDASSRHASFIMTGDHNTTPRRDSPPLSWESPKASSQLERPGLRSANTTPAPVHTPGRLSPDRRPPTDHDRNPWADEDDFGREKEVEMSFE
ncbi:hypothetical protein LTR56_027301 [Elasticomyces elasticus]|nr:hypothetical protein LTR56_027301 [Elasticomyces elasticus]KAK3666177.1 hypothetical protein LTR22_002841 [Elasticomyces elasticus]KAK4910337.1 hypothetical protein LTR49_020944 [Elasticomyces elasticus]KAK5763609.1 hypothetical protein LTS12_006166 [Elasticomyces elasticus]